MLLKKHTRKLLKIMVLGIVISLGVSSCARRTAMRVNVGHPKAAKVVVIKKGHVHSARCGHYKYGGKWYIVKGHVHGKRCGHHHVKGVWIYKK